MNRKRVRRLYRLDGFQLRMRVRRRKHMALHRGPKPIPTGPGDIVIADNLRGHKMTGVKEAVKAMGAQIRYLPPYSPILNPIEQLTAALKALLCKTATGAHRGRALESNLEAP